MNQTAETIDADVLIIGSGIAGLQAAMAASKSGRKTILVSKSPIGKANNTTLAGGGFSFATDASRVGAHIEKTMESGRFLNDRKLVTFFAQAAPDQIEALRQMGLDGKYSSRGFTCRSSALIGGPDLTGVLGRACRSADVAFLENVVISDLVISDGRCCGAVGFQKRSGDIIGIRAKASVLATGGAGAIYAQNDNAPGATGDGYALSLDAGLELLDIEFVQFYPLVYAGSGRSHLILPTSFGDLGDIVNRHGEDLKKKYGLDRKPIAVVCRDRLSQALFTEVSLGNGVDGAVLLDLRKAHEKDIPPGDSTMMRYRRKLGYDKEPIKILPACHHTMGGVKIDSDGGTGLEGLYAAGEVSGTVHGANRMGGNALSEGLVFGEAAGRSAAAYAGTAAFPAATDTRIQEIASKRCKSLIGGAGGPSGVGPLKNRLKRVLWEKVGIVRSRHGLEEGIQAIDEIRNELMGLRAAKPSDLCKLLECRSAARVGKAVALAALARTESRGAHCREDFPKEDEAWRKHIHVRLADGALSVSRMVSIEDGSGGQPADRTEGA